MARDLCSEFLPLIVRAGDGSLSRADRARLDEHLATCAACRRDAAAQQQIHQLLARREPDRAPLAFRARVLSALEREAPASWWARIDFRSWTWRVAPVTAALAVLAYAYGASPTAAGPDATGTLATSGAASTVSTALVNGDLAAGDALWLLLFADPDQSLQDAWKEIPQ